MADPLERFHILEDLDLGDGSGQSPGARIEGQASASIEGMIGFAFKDSAGNVVLPQLDSSGNLPVISDPGIEKSGNGEVAAGSLTVVDVATITLTTTKKYDRIRARGCSRFASLWQIFGVEDEAGTPVELLLEEGISGPGQYTVRLGDDQLSYTALVTGVLMLKLKAKNFNVISSLRGTITALEK